MFSLEISTIYNFIFGIIFVSSYSRQKGGMEVMERQIFRGSRCLISVERKPGEKRCMDVLAIMSCHYRTRSGKAGEKRCRDSPSSHVMPLPHS